MSKIQPGEKNEVLETKKPRKLSYKKLNTHDTDNLIPIPKFLFINQFFKFSIKMGQKQIKQTNPL